MITIKKETFEAMFNKLEICEPMTDVKLKEINDTGMCGVCPAYDICHIIADDDSTQK